MLRFLLSALLVVAASAYNLAVLPRSSAVHARTPSPTMMPKFLKDLFPDLPKPGEIRVLGSMGCGLTLFPREAKKLKAQKAAAEAPAPATAEPESEE